MIWRTKDNKSPNMEQIHDMPNLEHFLAAARFGVGQAQRSAQHVLSRRVWDRYHWQPEAAERALRWIRTGSWSLEG